MHKANNPVNTFFVAILLVAVGVAAWFVFASAYTLEEASEITGNWRVVDWSQVQDDPAEKITIYWYPLPRYANGREGAYQECLLEELFNVEIKPVLADSTAYRRRKPLMFAGGNIPDITWDGDPIDVQRDASHGCIVPIPREVIKRYAPTYYRLVSEHAPTAWLYGWYQGQNWGLPTIYLDGAYSVPGTWREDWLRSVGIEKLPETLDEFHDALYALTFNDPDGNGRDDTYGMSGSGTVWWNYFTEVFGAYGVLFANWMERDGRVVWGGVLPETREALSVLRDWYAEGIIDPEFVTDGIDPRRLRNKLLNGKIGYISLAGIYDHEYFDSQEPASLVSMFGQLNPGGKLTPAPFPIGPDGKRGGHSWGAGGCTMVFGPGILEQPQKLIRILKIYEYQVANGPDIYIQYTMGEFNKHWEYRIEGDTTSGVHRKAPYADFNLWQKEVLCIFGGNECHPDYDDRFSSKTELEFRKRFKKKEWALFDIFGKPGVVPSSQKYLADLRICQLQVFTEIIRGEKPLEAFDDFVENWYARGGMEMTREANELMEVKRRIFAETAGTTL